VPLLPIFYHIDRVRTFLEPGKSISLSSYVPPHYDTGQVAVLRKFFPSGLSRHGTIFIDRDIRDPLSYREWFLENYRRKHHPHLPSRFACYFACKTLEEAKRLKTAGAVNDLSWENAFIWSVEAESLFDGDIGWLNPRFESTPDYYSRVYWQRIGSVDPLWECLLTPPILMIERLE
jgi:Protein of unknown function (DUF2441)